MSTTTAPPKSNPYTPPGDKTQKTDSPKTSGDPPGTSVGQWLALIAALLGWMFDGAEMGVFSLVGRSAVKDLLARAGATAADPAAAEQQLALWFGIVTAGFLIGAAVGGVVFGWLGDRIGRVRAMTLSVLTYAVFTGLCGVCSHPGQILLLRFVAALGMGGEWSLGVALVMEVWPNRSRAFMAGLIGAAANVGYALVGVVQIFLTPMLATFHGWFLSAGASPATADWFTANQGWRLMMMLGVVPALLTFFIRAFVPESEKWQHEQKSGTTSNWSSIDLLGVAGGVLGPFLIILVWALPSFNASAGDATTIAIRLVTTLGGIAVAAIGFTYPVLRFLQRQRDRDATTNVGGTLRRMLLAAVLSGIALMGTWGSIQWAPTYADKLTEPVRNQAKALADAGDKEGAARLQAPIQDAKAWTLIAASIGATLGTIFAAMLGDWIGRRPAYCLLCIASLVSVIWLYVFNKSYGHEFLFATFLGGACTASFYGWLPLYLPELFRTNVRATGQGFGFNFGRILAAIGALQTATVFKLGGADGLNIGGITIPPGYPLACSAISLVYLLGLVLIWLAPETKGEPLPE